MPYYPPSQPRSADTTSFLAGGDIQAATVQAAIAEVAAERAKNGENTDITSLGTADQVLFIKGQLRVPNTSRFEVFQSQQQVVTQSFAKILFQSKLFDSLNEFNLTTSSFTPLYSGIYLFNIYTDIFVDVADPTWRVVLGLRVREVGGDANVFPPEAKRFIDANLPLANAGPSGSTFLYLNAGSVVEAHVIFTTKNFTFFNGQFAARLTAVKIT